jgi:regulator of protease activity HflC (stomatin/prohibitin superfamily)
MEAIIDSLAKVWMYLALNLVFWVSLIIYYRRSKKLYKEALGGRKKDKFKKTIKEAGIRASAVGGQVPIESMQNALDNSALEEREKNKHAFIVNWALWIMLFIDLILGDLYFQSLIKVGDDSFFSFVNKTNFPFLGLFVFFLILIASYRSVPHNHNWTVEFLGEWFATWNAGPHFIFPFIEKVSGKVYMGSHFIDLYTWSGEGEERSIKIDFKDASAPVSLKLFLKIFSAHRAIYEVDDFYGSIAKKMDAGFRAFLGEQTLDDVIEKRAEINLQKIIDQDVTGSRLFKEWGAFIEGIALTDINLTPKVEEQRNKKLEATKKKEVAEIDIKTAEHQASAMKITKKAEGIGAGQEIIETASKSGLTNDQAAQYLMKQAYIKALSGKGILIAGSGGDNFASIGSQFATGMKMVGEANFDEKDKDESKGGEK